MTEATARIRRFELSDLKAARFYAGKAQMEGLAAANLKGKKKKETTLFYPILAENRQFSLHESFYDCRMDWSLQCIHPVYALVAYRPAWLPGIHQTHPCILLHGPPRNVPRRLVSPSVESSPCYPYLHPTG